MKPKKINPVRGGREWIGYDQQDVADYLGITVAAYRKKESGGSTFTDEQKVKLAELFGWSAEQMNDYLYGGILPIGKATLA